MRSVRSVCQSINHSVCEQDYCKTNRLISLKLGVMIGPTNWMNWLTSVVIRSRIPDHFHFPHHCGIGDFMRFIIQSSDSHQPIFTTLGEMTDAIKIINPQHFGSEDRSGSES